MNCSPCDRWRCPRAVLAGIALTLCVLDVRAETLSIPSEYATIQTAIDAAVDGDTVLVADGLYTGPGNRDIEFAGKAITVRSENGAAACVIDCQGSLAAPHRAFRFRGGETAASVLEGITVLNGFMDFGGAIVCEGGASPTVVSCVFEQNSAHSLGAGSGGGAVHSTGGSPQFSACVFRRNTAIRIAGPQGLGGALRFVTASPVLIDCMFEENTAGTSGGGVQSLQSNATFTGCTFLRNQTTAPFGVGGGGGYIANGGQSTLLNCAFVENRATNTLGGVWISNGGTATITGCSFIRNYGFDAGGLGVGNGGPQAVITNCLFDGNTADIFSAALEVWNAGGNPAQVSVANCTFINNAATQGYAAVVVGNTSNLVGSNCILWDNEPAEITLLNSGTATFAHSDIQGGWPGAGNIDADPLFAAVGESPYTLSRGSPCIDSGDSAAVPASVTLDLAGDPRFIDDPCSPGVASGAVVDMGAYEYSFYPDCNLDGALTIDDLICFLMHFAEGDAYADCNGDGQLTYVDWGCFRAHFAVGCR